MVPLKYPIGIQTFENIRQGGYVYADKTKYIYDMVSSGARHVFLSRPRRFGKSLFLSTLQAYFEGRKDLFEGLALGQLETKWESYPVLRFSFGSIEPEDPNKIANSINVMLKKLEEKFDVAINNDIESFGTRFGELIQNVAEKTGKQVVVLVDEYDKGIVDILQNEEKLAMNISLFRPFYAQLKDQEEHLRFAFLTGVSRFRNLTLFSSPNHLGDISLDPRYAAICGLTSEELSTNFTPGIENLADKEKISMEEAKEKLKLKYDGYRFTRDKVYVYNPFSILNCLDQGILDDYWLESGGTSKVFIDFLKHADYNLEEIEEKWVSASTLRGPYSLEDPIPLLFQTGYLTLTDYDDGMYRLGIPNGEVRTALITQLFPLYLGINRDKSYILAKELGKIVRQGNPEELMMQFQNILSQISHQHFRHNAVENIYNLSLWLICKMAGINARSEVSVAGGDIDMLIETQQYVYVLEFKKDHSAEEALMQIDTKAYAIPWKADCRKVFKIGIEFSSSNRNITNWMIKTL